MIDKDRRNSIVQNKGELPNGRNYSRCDSAKVAGKIDDRTITRRAKGGEENSNRIFGDGQSRNPTPSYRAQSAKNRDNSRYLFD